MSIEAGVDVNAIDEDGYTPLYWAVRMGNVEVAYALLEAGDDCRKALLSPFIGNLCNNPKCAILLLQRGAELPENIDFDYSVILLEATKQGADIAFNKVMVSGGLETIRAVFNNDVLFRAACENGNAEIIDKILQYHGKLQQKLVDRAAGQFIEVGNIDALHNMHDAGVIDRDDKSFKACIEDIVAEAVKAKDYVLIAKYIKLYDYEEDFHLKTELSNQALLDAAIEDEDQEAALEAIAVFARAGFEMQGILNRTITTASECETICFADDVAQVIIKYNQTIDCSDAFVTAIVNYHMTAAHMLFDKGVDLTATASSDYTPLFFLKRYGCDLALYEKIQSLSVGLVYSTLQQQDCIVEDSPLHTLLLALSQIHAKALEVEELDYASKGDAQQLVTIEPSFNLNLLGNDIDPDFTSSGDNGGATGAGAGMGSGVNTTNDHAGAEVLGDHHNITE